MIELIITNTGKSYNPRDGWRIFGSERQSFADTEKAEAWINERYGKSKRSPMYIDTVDPQTKEVTGAKRIGYIIGFRNADFSHYPVDKWLQQDWIEFRECKSLDLDSVEVSDAESKL
jgi:hypothetical protein